MNYRVNGTADLEQIRQTSPVSIYCGGRFVLPLILCFSLSTALMSSRHIAGPYEAATMTLAYLVTVFWLALVFLLLDACCELGRMPVFGWVTRWIQQRFTTQAPGEAELRTAHRALEELLAAERQTATEVAA
jgi:ABC-type antimicrobial peptide transport system permease subunit